MDAYSDALGDGGIAVSLVLVMENPNNVAWNPYYFVKF